MTRTGKPSRRRARAVEAAKPRSPGWHTTDEEEIERRRQRGAEEPLRSEALEPDRTHYGSFLVRSGSDTTYEVEIRSLQERINSCGCPDFRTNRLGTCKHIEAVLLQLHRKGVRKFRQAAAQGSPRVEIYLAQPEEQVRIAWPRELPPDSPLRTRLDRFFSSDGGLLADPVTALPALRRAIAEAPEQLQAAVRLSRHLPPWVEERRRKAERTQAREAFLKDVEQGKRSLDFLKIGLYAYQQQGMLHLAFTERALLADEMGLGKTVQAVAACELLRRLRGIRRVLVIAPASLKAEWEEQIAKFTDLDAIIVRGTRPARLQQYRQPAFFHLTNYEQILSDRQDIQTLLAPEVIVLDEAQRIKNWQTKTAEAVKKLSSRYAFVLTGTPLENRIDEIYSIVQFLDPQVFGPLFRFNRRFYELDERGKPVGYKNLDELHRRLQPLMLRRRKEEVEGQLPGRTVNTYFVSMEAEQSNRYDEFNSRVAKLTAIARRRPLTPQEFEQLQK